MKAWIPKYLRWYRFAYGPQLTVQQVRDQAAEIARRNNGAAPAVTDA